MCEGNKKKNNTLMGIQGEHSVTLFTTNLLGKQPLVPLLVNQPHIFSQS